MDYERADDHFNRARDWRDAVPGWLECVGCVMSEWISVNDRLPDVGGEYIIYDNVNESVSHDYWQMFGGHGAPFTSFWNHYGEWVTHWMPLPEPPKDGQ